MAINDCKIGGVPTDAQASGFTMNNMGNRFQPDVPGLPADEMKSVMDELSTKVLAPAHNRLINELAPLESSGFLTMMADHHIVTTTTGATGDDIPTLSAIGELGGGDMLMSDFCGDLDPGENSYTVDHALVAENAKQLGGYAADHFAAAEDVSSIASSVTNIINTRGLLQFHHGDVVDLGTNSYAGAVIGSGTSQTIRFTVPLWRTIPSNLTPVITGTMDVYGANGRLINGQSLNSDRGGTDTVHPSWNMLQIYADVNNYATLTPNTAVTVRASLNIHFVG